MELHFPDGIDLSFDPNCEIELPPYVKRLSSNSIAAIRNSSHRENLIVAAGADPKDNKVTLLTATNRVLVFDASKYYVPPGPALPCDDGSQIFFPNTDGRWPGPSKGFYVEATWLIEKSQSALVGATLQTNYRNEDRPKNTEAADTRRG